MMWVMALAVVSLLAGCDSGKPKPYQVENRLELSLERPMVWAVAPAVDLSGQKGVDPLLQADLLYQQLQEVKGLTIVPVNRTAQAMWQLGLDSLGSERDVAAVCRNLDCDGLVIPTVTAYDPFAPPKFGGSLQLFVMRVPRAATQPTTQPTTQSATQPARVVRPAGPYMVQSVGMFDAANGSVHERLMAFAQGRVDPNGPLPEKMHVVVMDRFVGFAWHELTAELLVNGGFGR
jgi:hypothetical protein